MNRQIENYTGPGAKRIITCVADGCEARINAPVNHPWNIIGWLRQMGWAIAFKGNNFFPACPNHGYPFPKLRANAKGYRRPL